MVQEAHFEPVNSLTKAPTSRKLSKRSNLSACAMTACDSWGCEIGLNRHHSKLQRGGLVVDSCCYQCRSGKKVRSECLGRVVVNVTGGSRGSYKHLIKQGTHGPNQVLDKLKLGLRTPTSINWGMRTTIQSIFAHQQV
jgi:hypothetical protein